MNNPLSDGNENVIDIFVLGESEAGTLELNEQLENQDYRVTHFTDGQELIATLRSGRPNLIICDTTTFGQEAYDYCRQIKSDDTLWMIPVMILTRASSLSDLLNVLDSNGDNFIAQPYDFPYLLSLIEGMLATPVERLTSDQIKTQFKIQHDDKIFVVTADRRKLLEFLLSAFEIAVKNSEDLSAAQAEFQALSSRITILEDAGIDNARVIGMLNTDIRKKEQEERTLKGDLEEIEKALDEKTAESADLTRALGENKALLTTAEDHVRMLLEEKEKTASCTLSETTLLTDQVTALSQEISLKTADLNAVQHALDGETARSANLDLALKKSKALVEQLETSLQSLTLEHADRTSALSSEKKRADAAELETKSVLLAKTQSEEELTVLFTEMKDSARQQNDELLRLKTALESETDRCSSAETRLETFRHEMDQLKATHDVQEESHNRLLEDLQSRLDTAIATIFSQERELQHLKDERIVAHADEKKAEAAAAAITAALNEARVGIEEREWKIQSFEKEIADAGIREAAVEDKIRALMASLENAGQVLKAEKEQHATVEERLNAVIRERDAALQSVQSEHERTKADLDQEKNNLVQLNRDLEAASLLRSTLQGDITQASSRIKELEHELKSSIQAKSQTGEQVRELAEELERTKAAFNEVRLALSVEKKAHELLEGELDAAIRERDATLQSVQGAHDQTKSDLDLHKKNLLQLNQDLEAATRIYSSLLADFKDASSRIDELESELNSAGLGKEQASVQIRSLADDLERAKVELEAEQRIRRIAETNLQTETQVTARLKGDIARSTAEHEGLKTALEQEKRLHFATVEKARAATLAKELADHEFTAVKEAHERKDGLSAAKIQELSADFERALARLRELEQEVKTLEYEKTAAEARVESLSDEIQQARTALADEWENHMDDEERLAATERKAVLLEQSLSGPVKGTPERERKWAVVMKQTDLPAEFRPAPKAIVITHAPAIRAEPVVQATPDNDPEVSLSLEIEDLFEDVQPGPGKEERMTRVPPSPLAGSAAETQDMATEEDPANEPEPDEGELEADVAEEDEGESDDEEVEDQRKNLDDFMTTPSGYGISFNRQQWFDLLKWSHHSGALSQEQRMQIVRMGRLIQNGRKLTAKQDEQVREMIVLVQTLGYRFH